MKTLLLLLFCAVVSLQAATPTRHTFVVGDGEFLLDGKPFPFRETADHFTYIRCPAGSHVLTVKARLGWLRTVTLLLSLISLPLIAILVLRRSARSKV